jgi:rieske iron-sulfur protein
LFSTGCDGDNVCMSECRFSSHNSAPPTPAEPRQPSRRALLLGALASGTCLATTTAIAAEERPGSDRRPQKNDLLVIAEGEREGQLISPGDLKPGDPPLLVWPKDPDSAVIRDGSRLNELLLVRLAPDELDEVTRPRAADGIVAYSAVCTHAGCPVTAWMKASEGGGEVFKCLCHNSEFDPRRAAQVVFGPAPRRLAALPLAIIDGALVVAGPFAGKVGGQQG